MKILMIGNSLGGLISFRKEMVEALVEQGYDVTVITPDNTRKEEIRNIGARFIPCEIDSRGTNPINDLALISRFVSLFKREKPDAILTYTVKPNLYAGFAAKLLRVPQIANITGLGTAVENKSNLQELMFFLYKACLKKAKVVFFQNQENLDFCLSNKLVHSPHRLIPGSGVNLSRFKFEEYPDASPLRFIFVSRLIKEKGIDQYLEAAEAIKSKYPDIEFHILGGMTPEYEKRIDNLIGKGVISFHGHVSDVRPILNQSHCLIHPTYYPEGMSNVLLEACATGRPVMTTNRSGCREIVDDGVTGFIVSQQNTQDLVAKIEKFISLDNEERARMGLEARKKVEREFDRNIVINAYLEEIEKIKG